MALIGSKNLCSRRWVWEQYDTMIQGNTKQRPGGDAGVIRVDGTKKGLAFTVDVTPRYCKADPFEGGKQAVAESWRNLNAVGAEPLATTDNLNFGNPEKPEIMGQFVGCIKGVGAACEALDMPIVSGNVSLYNETSGEAILPTPAIGAVGLLPDVDVAIGNAFVAEHEVIVLIGGHGTEMGQSTYLAELFGREEGAPPPVDLELEKKNGTFVREAIRAGTITAAHDISDGGLGITVAEMAIRSGLGCTIELPAQDPHIAFYAEDQARYVVTCCKDTANALLAQAEKAGVQAGVIGLIEGDKFSVAGHGSVAVSILSEAHENWLPAYMAQ